ncbi:MAG TPA: hypothetical protein PK523_09990, partial [Elusimicrobiales bacterium]|nr:hypothetical protein [Elusimicrobiales bacterium]
VSSVTVNGALTFSGNSGVTVDSLDPYSTLSFTSETGLTITSATFRANPSFGGTNTVNISTLATTTSLTVPANTTITHYAPGPWKIAGALTVGGELVQDTTYTWNVAGDLAVQNGGVLRHTGNAAVLSRRLNITVGGDLDLQSGSLVHGDAMGYTAGGPGMGTNGAANGAGGGGHGGAGGQGAGGAAGGAANDAFNLPVDMGSSGGQGYTVAYPGGSGGGYVRIAVAGSAAVNGTVSVDGGAGVNGINSNGTYGASGGGAGGSVHLIANTISGAGTISAEGGAAGNDIDASDQAGGGGGGLIRLDVASYDYNHYSGGLFVYGGARSAAGGASVDGSPGRIEPSTATVVDNDGGQRTNSLTVGDLPDANLFGFKIRPYLYDMRVNSLVIRLSDVGGVADGDWSDVRIYQDTDGNGYIDAGETTAVGGAGAVNTGAGTITFSAPFVVPAAGMNYVMRADLADLSGGDTFRLYMQMPDIVVVSADNTTKKAVKLGFSVGDVVHTASSIIVWDGGGGDGMWNTADNWDPNRVPILQSDVYIDANATVTAAAGATAIRFNTLTLGTAAGTYSPTLVISTTIAYGGDIIIDNGATLVYDSDSEAVTGGNVEVKSGGTLLSDTTTRLFITGDLTVRSGGVVSHNVNAGTLVSSLDLYVGGSLDIQSGGWVHADAKGYSAGGPGAGTNGGANGGGGGGHGGAGGLGGNLAAGGVAYDNYNLPLDAGSQGGQGYTVAYPGGTGGGYIKLDVAGWAAVNGTLSADGGAGTDGIGTNTTYGAAGGG